MGARIMEDVRLAPQWAEWRTLRASLSKRFTSTGDGAVSIDPMLVPPNADGDARFHVQLLQNMLDVLLHGARAASENLSDLGIAFSGRDPFHHFALAPG